MTGVKNKKKIYNLIMVVAVALIVFSGVMITGSIKGWFDTPIASVAAGGQEQGDAIIIKEKIGGANIERRGIAYSLDDGTRLKDGDIIETLNRSSIKIEFQGNQVYLNQNSKVLVHSKGDDITLELKSGDVFAQASKQIKLNLMNTEVTAINSVFGASTPSGSARVSVFENSVQVGSEKVEAGYATDILTTGIETVALSIQSLNEFNINHIRKANDVKKLCFSNSDLDKVEADRLAEIKAAKEAKKNQEEKDKQIKQQQDENKNNLAGNGSSDKNQSQGGNGLTGGGGSTSKPSNGENALECTIEIRCDTILNNMGDLDDGKSGYVPANGIILSTSTIEFEAGETVFDVLKRACELAGIQLEYSWTPVYNSYYIEGINNLYEFDCGNESGWMYKVNGWFPNYGCSAYKLQDGDTIVFCYTCKGLGADVGGGV